MTSTRLVLIRHGQTASNGGSPGMRMSGWTDLPLTERGWHQAKLLRRRLEAGAPFAAIYTSPLQRARDTALGLYEAGLGPLRVREDLREIHCGEVDGRPVDEVQRHFSEYWEANLRQEDEDFRWPGGESYREFRERCLRAIRALAAAHPGERVAVVTHSGLISQVLGALHGLSPARWEPFRPDNTALTELDWSGEHGVLVRFDDRAHLAGLDAPEQHLLSANYTSPSGVTAAVGSQ
jgi:broad specificity phosphatase PhoE